MFILFEVLIAFALIAAFIHFQITKRKYNYQTSLLAQHIHTCEELKRTLAMGLYMRFKKEDKENTPNYSSLYILDDPLTFEDFVADLFEKAEGGSTWVSPSSGDFGVDFEHRTKDGLFLGQVKCWGENLSFQPIALVHSNMVKTGADGGYVITTSSFTTAAREYAEGLDIELIDGTQLVDIWIKGLINLEEEIKKLSL